MIDFTTWFLSELPDFLMSDPIIYFVGILVSFGIVALIGRLLRVR